MRNYAIFSLYQALLSLDGYIQDGKVKPYDFEPMANHAIAKNTRLLEGHVKDLKEGRRRDLAALVPQGQSDVKLDNNDSRLGELQGKWIEVLNQEIPVNLYRVSEDLFHFDTNPVPLAVQRALAPILIDVPIEDSPSLGGHSSARFMQNPAEGCASSGIDSAGRHQE